MSSQWIKCIATHGNIRGVALEASELIQELVNLHGVKGDVAQALGESVLGALMFASYCKSGERVNLNIRSSAFIAQSLTDAYPDGTVRGYVVEREFKPGQVDTTENFGPWGDGLLSVLRTKTGERERPYIGTVPLVTGYLAKDLTFYWLQSEQIPSAVGIAVKVDGDKVIAAGGFLVQAMPGATAEELLEIEQHINEIQSLAGRLTTDSDPVRLLSQIFQSTAFILLEEKPLRFQCQCSLERVERALTLVGVTELQDMLETQKGASIRCDFCTKQYIFDAKRLAQLISMVSAAPSPGSSDN
jgi:molecular chaperone Hsp33